MIDTTRKISAHLRIVIAFAPEAVEPCGPASFAGPTSGDATGSKNKAGGELIAARFVSISLVADPAGETGMGGIIARQATRCRAGADDARRRGVGHARLVVAAAADPGGRGR